MFSCHVFQHFSRFQGVTQYLEETYRVLDKGATLCLHIPVPGAHRAADSSLFRLTVRNAFVSLRRALGARRIMEYHRYDPKRIFRTLEGIGFGDPELRIFNMNSNGDGHSFFFARRP